MPKQKINFSLYSILLVLAVAVPSLFINFPAGDSWTHGWTVREWLHGNFILNDWSSALALPQQILGWIVCLGSSDDLPWFRLSILTAVLTTFGCIIAARLPSLMFPAYKSLDAWKFIIPILILSAPFTLKAAAGFMTDGYYFFFLVCTLYFLITALDTSENVPRSITIRRWIGFAAFGTLAALERSHGIAMLGIVGLWLLLTRITNKSDKNKSSNDPLITWLPILLSFVGFFLALIISNDHNFAPIRSSEVANEIKNFWTGRTFGFGGLIKDRIWLIFGILQHFGLALLPIALIAKTTRTADEVSSGRKNVNWWYVGLGALFMLMVFARLGDREQWGDSNLFPYLGNSITPEGFGPRKDTLALVANSQLDPSIRMVLTVLGTAGGIILIWLMSRTIRFRKIDWRAPSTLIGIIGLAHLGLVLLNPNFFDRYLLPLFPFAIIWLAPILKDAPHKTRLFALILVLIYLGFSVWGTYDALSFSKAKWDIALKAHDAGILPSQIVSGYEPDGYFNFTNEKYRSFESNIRPDPNMPWWIHKLSLRIEPEYVVIEKGAVIDSESSPWRFYERTEIENGRMEVLKAPAE